MTRWVAFVVAGAIAVDIALLVSGQRILISETKVQPGETYEVPGWGNVGAAQQTSLVCHYFTGRSIQPQVFWYSPNNLMGKDSCPFLVRP